MDAASRRPADTQFVNSDENRSNPFMSGTLPQRAIQSSLGGVLPANTIELPRRQTSELTQNASIA